MNIVYGVSGEGFGHVVEARELVPLLRRDGHEVKVLTYGDRACSALAQFQPTRIEGLPLYFGPRGLSLLRTLARNAHVVPFYLRHWRRLRAELEAFGPDVFITAFEPFTTLAARALRRPLVSMDNQRAILYLRQAPRGHRLAFSLARLAVRAVTHGASHYLVKTLLPAASADPRVRFVAPIVQGDLRRITPSVGPRALVYLTKPNPPLLALLRQIEGEFVVYSGHPPGREGNLLHRSQGPGFVPDLAECRAVIGTAGFSLIADAIYLRKPYFAVPLKGQFEQTLNAHFLGETGLGEFSEDPTAERLRAFFGRLPLYRERLAQRRFDPAEQEEALRAILRALPLQGARPVTDASPAWSPK